jgi:uncharacterized membrane protein YphA (DoxX/SURF4 family)
MVLGATFVYLGAAKALDPVGFLKLVRQFDLPFGGLTLNAIAALLPWLEIFCGALLILGWKARGAALLLLGMLAAFTAVVTMRAWGIHATGALPFCSVRFDCGCGAGEVVICTKLLENLALMVLAAFVAFAAPAKHASRRIAGSEVLNR